MNIVLREYQQKAVDELFGKSVEFLKEDFDVNKHKRMLFKSPTGSGKTVMMAKVIERLAMENDESVSFAWVSKGVLPAQSKKSFENIIGGGGLTFSFLEDVLDNEIKENEVLFFNWEKVFSKAGRDNPDKDIKKGDPLNQFMTDNEWDKNLRTFCENARDNDRKIILIVDESHTNATQNTEEIIANIINPALVINVTATPREEFYDNTVQIGLQEVKDSGIIKKEVVINADIKKQDLKKSEKNGDEIIFEKAIEKKNELIELYQKEKSDVRSLVLIQLPNEGEKLSALDKQKVEWVEEFLENKEINYENGRLAKWLSDKKDKVNLENISNFDNGVEFLIFKQAIALGWDCPRAHILVKFRETSSEVFEIQTVGRIMRMPEFKHYNNEELNRAYVFANLTEIQIDEDALEYLKTNKASRKKEYENLDLQSVYLMRGEYNDLTYAYRKYFFKEFLLRIGGELNIEKAKENFKKFKSNEKIDIDVKRLEEKIILDESIEDINDLSIDIVADDENKVILSDEDIEKAFIGFLKKNCGEFQKARSFDKIRVAIYQTFDKYLDLDSNLKLDKNENKLFYQKIVLKNINFFREVINQSVEKYAKNRHSIKNEYKKINDWNVPVEDFYPKGVEQREYKKCVMNTCFVLTQWQTEIDFIEKYLEKSSGVDWWYKNGDSKNEIYFGIPFINTKDKNATFYPDFIVKYTNGKVGIFDTKKGNTAESEDTRLKAEVLQKYIKRQGKNLFGGILIPSDKQGNVWKLNQEDKYDYKNGNWEILE
jgi:type III restriction enzyme